MKFTPADQIVEVPVESIKLVGTEELVELPCVGCEIPVETIPDDPNPTCDDCLESMYSGF